MLTIRPMKPSDISRVHEIEQLSFITPWSYASLMSETQNPLAYYAVVCEDKLVVGYAGMWLIYDEAHVTNVAVHPDYRSRGIGRSLMEHMICVSREKGAQLITLEVRSRNTTAQSLYFSMNFIQSGVRKGYYTDTKDDALILWKQI